MWNVKTFNVFRRIGRYFMYVLLHIDVKYKDFVCVLGLGLRLVILFLYLFYCALMYVLLYINVHTTSPLVTVIANHISAPPAFPHPTALGIRIVRLYHRRLVCH